MKKLALFAFAVVLSTTLTAQLQTPAPSPAATFTQVVGLTDVAVDYSRPAMRGRTIFGDLVPYGKVWRTGANARTKVTALSNIFFITQFLYHQFVKYSRHIPHVASCQTNRNQ